MKSAKNIVITAYGTWAKASINPAAQVLRGIEQCSWQGHNVIIVDVPVLTEDLFEFVKSLIAEHKPDYWLSLGVAPGSPIIRLEAIGTNWRHFDTADNAGITLEHTSTIEGGPAAYNATIPNHRIVEAIRAESIPAEVSYFAGNHLCNQMLYTLGFLRESLDLKTKYGFMHVPYSSEFVASQCDFASVPPSMDLAQMIRAGNIAVQELISHTEDHA